MSTAHAPTETDNMIGNDAPVADRGPVAGPFASVVSRPISDRKSETLEGFWLQDARKRLGMRHRRRTRQFLVLELVIVIVVVSLGGGAYYRMVTLSPVDASGSVVLPGSSLNGSGGLEDLAASEQGVPVTKGEWPSKDGSRSLFERLSAVARLDGPEQAVAAEAVGRARTLLAELREPVPGPARFDGIDGPGSDARASVEAMSSESIVKLMNSGRLDVRQLRALMSILWKRDARGLDRPLWSTLHHSDNLAVCVAATSLLTHAYGSRAGMFEFDRWEAFLASRL